MYVLSYEMRGTDDVSSSLISKLCYEKGTRRFSIVLPIIILLSVFYYMQNKLICNQYIATVIFSNLGIKFINYAILALLCRSFFHAKYYVYSKITNITFN